MDSETKLAARRYRRAARPLAFIGYLCTLAGLQFFTDPGSINSTALGRLVDGPADDLWSALFLVGGLGLIYGTQRPQPNVERASLIALAAALALNAAAVVILVGASVTLVPYVLCLLVFAERVRVLTGLDRRAAEDGGP